MTAKKTPLYDEHLKAGGNVVDYAGWMLPVQYTGLVPEHEAVRNAVGMFDISHMGEIVVKGKDALAFVDYLMTNDITTIVDNQLLYTFMCHPHGGVVDDLIVYRFDGEYFLLITLAFTGLFLIITSTSVSSAVNSVAIKAFAIVFLRVGLI